MDKKLHNKWLKAFKITLKEYEENRHDTTKCKLCNLTGRWDGKTKPIIIDDDKCIECPMNVFEKSYDTRMGCIDRFNVPINSFDDNIQSNEIQMVIEFYKKAIKIWKDIDSSDYETFRYWTNTKWSNKIKSTDEAVYELFNQE